MSVERNSELSDDQLVKKIRVGDHAAFKALFEKYWQELYLYAFNILRSGDTCEDIVQEVFVDLWQKATKQHILHIRGFLYKSVKFQVLNHIRNDKIHQKHLDLLQLTYSMSNLEDELHFRELREVLKKAAGKLPTRCREVFALSREKGLSNKEIAQRLNISVQTVKNQIGTALNLLRKALKDSYLLVLAMFELS